MPIPQLQVKQSSNQPVHESRRPEKKPGKIRKFFSVVILLAFLGFIAAAIGGIGIFIAVGRDLPDPNRIIERNIAQTTKIYDRTGENLLYEVYGAEKRTLLELNQIAPIAIKATLIAEDRSFYEHSGFDIRGIARAVWVDLTEGGKAQGGSTITQQLVKNAILSREKTYTRKIKELILSYEIEQRFSKDDILKMYFNEIPYGSTLYGIESASQSFFGKKAKDLSLGEATMLAALPQSPSRYSPYGSHRDELLGRQRYIISELESAGQITAEEAEAARKEPIFSKLRPKSENMTAPHFVLYVKDQLEQKYGDKSVEEGGLKVITTLDLSKQEAAEKAIADNTKNIQSFGAYNAALVSLNPKSGEILAMVGSRDYFAKPEPEGCTPGVNCQFDPQVNTTLRARQPGSSMKPIVYAASFIRGYTPDTILWDVVTKFKTEIGEDYEPHNYDLKERGPVTIKKALAGSLNVPAVEAIYLTGIGNVLDFAEKLGYTTLSDRSRFGLSLVLGGGEVKPLEHAAAFGAFANDGNRVTPVAVLRVEDASGNILEEWKPSEPVAAMDPQIAYQITDILSNNDLRAYIFGINNYLTFGSRPVAAKTGTTNDYHDAWTAGYTPSLVTVVWVGNSNNDAMKKKADGSVIAAPIWNAYMKAALLNTPEEQFTRATPVVTGKPVLDGHATGGYYVKVDRASGKLATEYTPESFIENRVYGGSVHNILYYVNKDDPRGPAPANPQDDPQYENWETAVQGWAVKNGFGQAFEGMPPTQYDDLHTPANRPEVYWLNPTNSARIDNRYVNLSITALARRGYISRVNYYLDDMLLGTARFTPYNLAIVIPKEIEKGFHVLKAEVFDDIDNRAESTITINLVAGSSEGLVSWVSPADGAAIPSFPVDLTLGINDKTLDRIDFFAVSPSSTEPIPIGLVVQPRKDTAILNWKEAAVKGFYKLYVTLKTDYGAEIVGPSIKVEVK